LLFLHC